MTDDASPEQVMEDGQTPEDPRKERMDLLRAVLVREEADSLGKSDSMAAEQIEAFERYTGQPYGNETVGRSSVHTREAFETIEWMRPDMARIFASGGKAVTFDPWGPGSEQQAEEATDAINQVFFEQQDGRIIVDTLFFDGAVQKYGVVAVLWEDATMGDPETYEGLNIFQAQQLVSDPNVDVLEAAATAHEPVYHPETGEHVGDRPIEGRMTVQRVKLQARPYVQNIAPDDFRISKRATNLDDPPYCGHVERMPLSELKLLHPAKQEELEEYSGSMSDTTTDERRSARFWDEDDPTGFQTVDDGEDPEVETMREYVHFDLDGDGYAELLECRRLGECVLKAEPVEEHPYAGWTPYPIPHKLVGLSCVDVVKDLQEVKTTLLRNGLDAVYQSVAPRTLVNKDAVTLSDLLSIRPGQIVRVKDGVDLDKAVRPLTVPDMSGPALRMMEYVDQAVETRSGVTRHAQGMDPDALNKTAKGIQLLQSAASVRKENIARNLASGLEMMFRKFYRLMVRNQQRPQQMRIGKEWRTYTPSTWNAEARVRVHVGLGTGDRDTELQMLGGIFNMQKEYVARFGPQNPFVTPKHMHNTIEKMVRVMGERSADAFFADPSTIPPEQLQAALQPPPNPKAQEVQMNMQMEQMRLQMDQMRMRMDAMMEREKTQGQLQLKREQIGGELQLKRETTVAELQQKQQTDMLRIVHGGKPTAPGAGVNEAQVGGQPG